MKKAERDRGYGVRRVVGAVVLGLAVLAAGGTARAASIDDNQYGSFNDAAYLNLGAGFTSVGMVLADADGDGSNDFQGSGTLIRTDANGSWVLTAAHMLYGFSSTQITLGGATAPSDYFVAHEKWRGDLSSGYDIGLMHFDADFGVTPSQLYSGTDEVGQVGTFVGFGILTNGSTGYDFDDATTFTWDGQRRAVQNEVDALLFTRGRDSRILLSDFDSGLASDNNWGSATGTPLEGSITPGDSGGGLFLDGLLAGVNSFGWGRLDGDPDSDYGDAFGVTRVSAFLDWIDATIAAFGAPAGDEPSTGGPPPGKGKNKTTGSFVAFNGETAAVPEPASLLTLAVFGAAFGSIRRRRS